MINIYTNVIKTYKLNKVILNKVMIILNYNN